MIKIITDSVASIPPNMLKAAPLEVVTLYLNWKGVEYADAHMDVDVFYSDIYEMANDLPTSSQPSQQLLEEAFRRVAQAGDQLLGIFASSGLSGTFEGVVRAARAVKEHIPTFDYALIDSQSCGFDEAWPVFDAAEAVKQGFSLDECIHKTLEGIKSTRFLFTPENLTFLQKGGRIGNAAALLGNLVHLAPVLTVVEGKATTVAKMRTRKKALERIIQEFTMDVEHYGLKNIAVHYIGSKTPALEWAKKVIEPLVGEKVNVLPVSPVIGLHVGPAVGIAYECAHAMDHKFPHAQPTTLVCTH